MRTACHRLQNRIAVEFYHALTDGTGGMVFLKSLLAEYIEQKYGVEIPNECGVLDRLTQPQEEELEDSFSKNAGSVSSQQKCEHRIQDSLYAGKG